MNQAKTREATRPKSTPLGDDRAPLDGGRSATSNYTHVTDIIGSYWSEDKARAMARIGLDEWGKRSRKGLKIGNRVDELCYKDWKEGSYKTKKSDPFEVLSCMKAWELFKYGHSAIYSSIEAMQETEYYEEWKVRGTKDIRTYDSIIDIKTSRKVSLDYWIQVAVYNLVWQKKVTALLMLDKDIGDYRLVTNPHKQDDLIELFIGRLNNYRFTEGDKL